MGIYGNDAGSGAASKPPAAPTTSSYTSTTASPTSTTETNSYKPTYSRENSFVGSDTGTTGGANWRSRVYGNDTDSSAVSKPPTAPITVSPTSTTSVTPSALRSRATTNSINSTDTNTNSTTNKDANSLPQIRLAIDKLTQDAKNENSTKKPEGLSPNAIKVLPTFNGSALNSKNKAPADFSSGEEESDDENNKKTENNVQSSNSKEKINGSVSPSNSTQRVYRHLTAVPDITPNRKSPTEGLLTTPKFRQSDRIEKPVTPPSESKWVNEKEEKTEKTPTVTITLSSKNNKLDD